MPRSKCHQGRSLHGVPPAALTMARMPARIASGSESHAFTTASRSGSACSPCVAPLLAEVGPISSPSAPDSAPFLAVNVVFSDNCAGSSLPRGGILGLQLLRQNAGCLSRRSAMTLAGTAGQNLCTGLSFGGSESRQDQGHDFAHLMDTSTLEGGGLLAIDLQDHRPPR